MTAKKDTLISVIIPVYNGSALIIRCLDSVFVQSGRFSVEVIVIDDGSTDNTTDLVSNYSRPVSLFWQKNLGPAAARNKAIEVASGKYLAFLDADDYWLPGFLQATVSFLEENTETVAVSVGQIHKRPGKKNNIAPLFLQKEPMAYSESLILPDFFEFWAKHNHVCTGSALIRTGIARLAGGMRENLRITEDLEFWGYIATFGKWGFIPKILFVSDGNAVTKQRGWVEKNMIRWASAPTMDVWENRIIKRIGKPLQKGYLLARGRIAGNLAYSMILSSRNSLGRQTIIEFRYELPPNFLMRILKMGSLTLFTWNILCRILRFREFRRYAY